MVVLLEEAPDAVSMLTVLCVAGFHLPMVGTPVSLSAVVVVQDLPGQVAVPPDGVADRRGLRRDEAAGGGPEPGPVGGPGFLSRVAGHDLVGVAGTGHDGDPLVVPVEVVEEAFTGQVKIRP